MTNKNKIKRLRCEDNTEIRITVLRRSSASEEYPLE